MIYYYYNYKKSDFLMKKCDLAIFVLHQPTILSIPHRPRCTISNIL